MSSPHVAAVAAMVRAINPSLANYKVWDRLTATAEDRGNSGWDPYYGNGIIDAYAATGPHVEIEGPRVALEDQECFWSVGVSGGVPPFHYYWYVDNVLVSTSSYYLKTATSEFDLRLEVADKDNVRDSDWFRVTLDTHGGEGCGW